MQIVGKDIRRVDAPNKARGLAKYTDDYSAENMLHVALVRSTVAHAKIVLVDTSNLDKDVYCFTAKDLKSNLLPSIMNDQPALACEKVRFLGEPIAVIAAKTLEKARNSAKQVKVTYEELPLVTDAINALKPDSSKLYESGNLCSDFHSEKGETEKALKECDLVLEDTFILPTQDHGYLEPEAAFTYIDDKSRLCLVSSTQNAFADRVMISSVLGIDLQKVHSKAATIGGGFGGKDGNTAQIFPAIVTHFTNLPAKLVFTREESLKFSYKRHSANIHLKMGFMKNGKINSYQAQVYFDTGAYAVLGPAVLSLGTEHLTGPYNIENVKLDGFLSYTNNTPASAMRGFGAPQGAMATESLINRAAKIFNIDEIEIRKVNAIHTGEVGAIGQKMEHSVGLYEALEKFSQSEFYREMKENKDKDIGFGIASGMMSSGMGKGIPDDATATIEKTDDGYNVRVGVVDIGQGSETALAMIASDALSVPIDKIKMFMADTDETTDSGSTAASRSVYICGNAILKAAEQINEGKDKATFTSKFPENKTDVGIPGLPHTLYGFIVQGAKVKIDKTTGAVKVLKVHNTTEAGTIINPTSMAGQIFGGIAMSTGYAISEQIRYQDGNSKEDSFANYVMPTAMDAPKMTSDNVEIYEKTGPRGAKGVAEASTVALAPAIATAVNMISKNAHLNKLPLDRMEILKGLD